MVIDWKKAREKPESFQKIKGQMLLDMEAKMNNLDLQLERYKVELSKKMEDILQIQNKLNNTQEHLSSVSELFTLKKDEIHKNEEFLKQERNVLKNINSQLEKSLIKVQKEKKDLEMELEKLSSEENDDLEIIISERDNEIEHLASIINDKDDQIKILEIKLDRKEKEISFVKEGLEVSIQDKDKLIEKLRYQLAEKTKDILELSRKVEKIEEYDDNIKISSRLIEKIYDILMHKGFLSDKEFEQLQSDIRKEELIYH